MANMSMPNFAEAQIYFAGDSDSVDISDTDEDDDDSTSKRRKAFHAHEKLDCEGILAGFYKEDAPIHDPANESFPAEKALQEDEAVAHELASITEDELAALDAMEELETCTFSSPLLSLHVLQLVSNAHVKLDKIVWDKLLYLTWSTSSLNIVASR